MKRILLAILFLPLLTQAITPVFTCGFECGINAAGAHWNQVGGSPTYSTTTVRSGARAIRFNPTASQYQLTNNLLSSNIMVTRLYVRFTVLPTSDNAIHEFWDGASATLPGVFFKSADSKLYAGSDNGGGVFSFGATGVAVTTGQWYRIDTKVNTSTNPWTIDVSIDGVACGQLTKSLTGVTLTRVVVGNGGANTTSDFFIDDLIVSNTSGDFPIAAGYVNHFTFTADGTHNVAGANDFIKGAAGVDITNATTDSYLLLDDVPLETAVVTNDFITALAPPNATDYVENKFGNAPGISTPTTAPRAVEVIVATHQAGTTTGDFKIDLNDNGTVGLIKSQTATAGVTTLKYATKQFATAPTGGAWTVVSGAGNFLNLRTRFYSADAAPDQYFDCGMIEAEFAEIVVTPHARRINWIMKP